MVDWNKPQPLLLAGACIAVFGSVYFFASRGREPLEPIRVAQSKTPPRIVAAVVPAMSAVIARPASPARAEPVPEQTAESSPADDSLRRMAENPTAADVAYLDDLAQRDADPGLRLIAIEGLQRAAISGGDGGASARALRRIAASRDPRISHAARMAISQVSAQPAEE